MMGYNPEQRVITEPSEVRNIPDQSARVAASIIFELHPNSVEKIGYETTEFFHQPHRGKIEGTRPDLSVTLIDGQEFIQEATISDKKLCVQELHSLPIWLNKSNVSKNQNDGIDFVTVLVEHDPKGKQKRVMQSVAPDIDYRVWYGKDLRTLRKVAKRQRAKRKIMESAKEFESVA